MKIPPSERAQQASGHAVGRISARKLVELHCRSCGRDLLPVLADALVRGCPCHRAPRLQVVQ